MTPRSPHDRRQRRVLIGLALLFFAPLGLAFYLYYGHGTWHPGARVNTGELVQPPRPLPALPLPLWGAGNTPENFLKGKWTFLYVSHGPCAQVCRNALYETRQVRVALDRDMNRVQRVFLAAEDCCDPKTLREQHPDLTTVRLGVETAPLLTIIQQGAGANTEDRIYIVDPLGNLMMSYAPNARPKGMLEDMKRLLRLSSIG